MTLETSISFKDNIIGIGDHPAWTKGEFVKTVESIPPKQSGMLEGPIVEPSDHIDQKADKNFIEFENPKISDLTGYQAEVMRAHGCGISSVYMALRAINGNGPDQKYKTVGEFATATLSLHKNDYVQEGIRHVGTPVFNTTSGWYHDALVYSAKKLGGIEGFRVEDVANLEDIGSIFQQLKQDYQKTIAIISVTNVHWRLKTEKSSVATHMVVVNGFKFREGVLESIRITDSYVSDHAKINEWVPVDERVRNAFTGKALFLYK